MSLPPLSAANSLCCQYVPSFAGFWYKFQFFKHFQDGNGTIEIQTTNKQFKLGITKVVFLDSVQDKKLELGVYNQPSQIPFTYIR